MTDPANSAAESEGTAVDAGPIDPPNATSTSAAPPPSSWSNPAPVLSGPAPGYAYVGFWRRFVAAIIDGILLTIVSYAIFIPMLLGSFGTADVGLLSGPNAYSIDPVTGLAVASPAAMAVLGRMMGQMLLTFGIVLLIQALYFVVLWTWRGATLGQMALGVEIRNESNGRRISLGRSLLRYLGYLISGWILGIGFIWVAFDRRKQGWHDKIGGTVVVRRMNRS